MLTLGSFLISGILNLAKVARPLALAGMLAVGRDVRAAKPREDRDAAIAKNERCQISLQIDFDYGTHSSATTRGSRI